jgi:hypothetical protein
MEWKTLRHDVNHFMNLVIVILDEACLKAGQQM